MGENLSKKIRELGGGNKEMQIFLLATTVDILSRVSATDDEKYFEIIRRGIGSRLGETLPEGEIPADYWNIDRIRRFVETEVK